MSVLSVLSVLPVLPAKSGVRSASDVPHPDPSVVGMASLVDDEDDGGDDDDDRSGGGEEEADSSPLEGGEDVTSGSGVDISTEEVYVTG